MLLDFDDADVATFLELIQDASYSSFEHTDRLIHLLGRWLDTGELTGEHAAQARAIRREWMEWEECDAE